MTSPILIVDDNPVNTQLYERVVAQMRSCTPLCFTNPAEALDWARDNLPALLVVDYRMPEIDGIEFIRRFRALPGRSAVPIVMLTSVGSPMLWQMALDAGASTYLMKPIGKTQFIETLERLLKPAPQSGK